MLEFLGLPQNQPFTTALLMMLGIAVLEGVATLLWGGVSQVIDSLIPDFDLDVDVDIDADADGSAHVSGHGGVSGVDAGVLTPVLSWLQIGKVPILILVVIFLTSFGLGGITIQWVLAGIAGTPFEAGLVSIPATVIGLLGIRTLGGAMARIMPKEETSAVSEKTFVGRIATIVLGTARRGEPTQARLRDEHGKSHYVMVEPDVDGEAFTQGDDVLIVAIDGPRFRVIAPPSDALLGSNKKEEDN